MKSIRARWPRHLGINDLLKKAQKVFRHREGHADASSNASLRDRITVSDEISKSQVDLTVPNPHFGKNIGADRLDALTANNRYGSISELNHFSALSHRSLLMIFPNGQAYDFHGDKWSRAS